MVIHKKRLSAPAGHQPVTRDEVTIESGDTATSKNKAKDAKMAISRLRRGRISKEL